MPLHDWTRVTPNTYHTFHQAWITALWNALNTGVLPAGYYAMTDQVAPPLNTDVLTLEAPPGGAASGGVALATSPPRVRFTATGRNRKAPPAQSQIRIRHNSNHRLVAVIEIVSPANKANRRELRLFLLKADALLRQNIHLLVIDPFPPTPRDPNGIHDAIWRRVTRRRFLPPPDTPLTLAAYAAEGAGLITAYVEPVAVGAPLPDMPLFLEDDTYVYVPLEATYRTAWAGFPAPLRDLLEPAPPTPAPTSH